MAPKKSEKKAEKAEKAWERMLLFLFSAGLDFGAIQPTRECQDFTVFNMLETRRKPFERTRFRMGEVCGGKCLEARREDSIGHTGQLVQEVASPVTTGLEQPTMRGHAH